MDKNMKNIENNVLEYLEKSAELYPDKIAVKDDYLESTYKELYMRAKQIGTALTDYTTVRKPVVVFMEKCVEALNLFLGIAYAGCFYVLIDPTYPAHRIEQILNLLDTEIIITTKKYADILTHIKTDKTVLDYDLINVEISEEKLASVRMQATDMDPLYCNFTSGSTGTPKGVLVSHGSVIDFIDQFTGIFDITSEDVFANQAPFDFDVSVKDIYSCLKTGATLVIIPRQFFMFPQEVMDRIEANNVTVLVWAVSAMCMVSRLHALKYKAPQSIRQIMFSGEKMPIKQLDRWMSFYPDARFVNLYGPTEITCNCTYHILDRSYNEDEIIPIGKPFPNEKVFLLNDGQIITEANVSGELCVAGRALALGYYKNEEITARSFVNNPANPDYPERIYKTGDLAFYGEDGLLYFSGRKDFQIKHMGHRIELEEIELYLNAVPGVEQCCCFFDDVKNKVVAFYVGDSEKRFIIDSLKEKVQEFMIPNVFVHLDELIYSNNGKIDRKCMKETYLKGGFKQK